jgi:multiple sugar transport system permease protein
MGRHRLAPYLLIAPSLLFLLLLFFVPLIQTVALAFQTSTGLGLGKFDQMVGDLDFITAIKDTFGLVIVVVPLQLALALGMAMMLRKVRFGRRPSMRKRRACSARPPGSASAALPCRCCVRRSKRR